MDAPENSPLTSGGSNSSGKSGGGGGGSSRLQQEQRQQQNTGSNTPRGPPPTPLAHYGTRPPSAVITIIKMVKAFPNLKGVYLGCVFMP